jgi:hypothetical protein
MWGIDYRRMTRADHFDGVEDTERTVLVEVVPDSAQTARFWERLDRR